jgi:hypothetical protein
MGFGCFLFLRGFPKKYRPAMPSQKLFAAEFQENGR